MVRLLGERAHALGGDIEQMHGIFRGIGYARGKVRAGFEEIDPLRRGMFQQVGGRKHAACPASDNRERLQLSSPLGRFWGISLRPEARIEKTIPDLIGLSTGSDQRTMSTVSKTIATRAWFRAQGTGAWKNQMSLTQR